MAINVRFGLYYKLHCKISYRCNIFSKPFVSILYSEGLVWFNGKSIGPLFKNDSWHYIESDDIYFTFIWWHWWEQKRVVVISKTLIRYKRTPTATMITSIFRCDSLYFQTKGEMNWAEEYSTLPSFFSNQLPAHWKTFDLLKQKTFANKTRKTKREREKKIDTIYR